MDVIRIFLRRAGVRMAGALAALAGLMAAPAAAQVTYADCEAFNGHVFLKETTDAFTEQTVTVSTILDGDAITIDIRALSGALGDYSAVIDVGGTEIFNETFSGVGTYDRSVTYDPPADATSVAFLFDTLPFTTPEGLVRFTVSCSPGTPSSSSSSSSPSPTVIAATSTNFVAERVRRILDEEPDRPRYVRKRLKALWGGGKQDNVKTADARGDPVLVGMAAREASLRAYAYANSNGGVTDGCGEDETGDPEIGCLDLWSEGHYLRFSGDGDREGRFAVGYVGGDVHINPSMIIGVLAQFDWMEDEVGSVSSKTKGVGWMVGPYASARLTPNLFVDARAAWGRSDTDINTLGEVSNFQTDRWLASMQVTGNFQMGDFRVSPEVSVQYIRETQDAFMLANTTVPEHTISIGRVRFGPEIAQLFVLENGMVIEPHASLRGAWDFEPAETVSLGAINYNDEVLRGIVEGGFIVHGGNGVNMRVTGKYDGIGVNNFQAYGGTLWVNVPLQ